MKVRIGIGAATGTPASLEPIVDGIAGHGFDSLWCSDVLTMGGFDPLIALTWAAARHPKLKIGTTMLLPGRNVVRLAKQLASLDALTQGRLLVTFVPGQSRSPETEAIGVPVTQRRQAIELALPLLRELMEGKPVTHDSAIGTFSGVVLHPLPAQKPLEFWLGGLAPKSLDTCGRLADGWLPSLCTPEQASAGRRVIEQSAADAGREISPEHFGVSIGYSRAPLDPATMKRFAARAGVEDIDRLLPSSLPALRRLLEEFLEAGFSKFVLRPTASAGASIAWTEELTALADAVLDLQT